MSHRVLDDATALRIETAGDNAIVTTWRDFCANNADGDIDLLDVQDRLCRSGRATVGGGAAPVIRVVTIDLARRREPDAPPEAELV